MREKVERLKCVARAGGGGGGGGQRNMIHKNTSINKRTHWNCQRAKFFFGPCKWTHAHTYTHTHTLAYQRLRAHIDTISIVCRHIIHYFNSRFSLSPFFSSIFSNETKKETIKWQNDLYFLKTRKRKMKCKKRRAHRQKIVKNTVRTARYEFSLPVSHNWFACCVCVCFSSLLFFLIQFLFAGKFTVLHFRTLIVFRWPKQNWCTKSRKIAYFCSFFETDFWRQQKSK